ncbi:polysaccharide pyruvyl transferase family protein [Pontiella sulfatireligans]|uniref:Polysaccharide pyruvyl transferase domain-containing protein n=1 Tax=Pontiella sulfatireligans TaxID=2750658 RepID=A0A6C2UN29_9BACT|nr:polysaccharide pyruvyl transferase family protein [Pontiella sulfatireligans]VGO21680.1 hypothetical protein SCARR_03754 [Pontiella sulfatireligans]
MKIGILTFHFCYNYGALLQCIGLYRVLKSIGHDVDVIDFHPVQESKTSLWQGWRLREGISKENFMRRWAELRYGKTMERRFTSLMSGQLTFSRQCNNSNVSYVVQDYDALIVGSDQVWNQKYYYAPPAYLLDFTPPYDGLKISYAACSGNGVIPRDDWDEVSAALKAFGHVSVRNDVTSHWFKQLAGRVPSTVCDPTLLVDFSDLEAKFKLPVEKYILIYVLGDEIEGGHAKAVSAIKKKMGDYPVVWICPTAHRPECQWAGADHIIYDAGPGEWLTLFKNAAFVYTDSFHGAVFSMKYQRPFLAYYCEEMRSHRLRDLAKRYGVESAVVSGLSDAMERMCINDDLDYEQVLEKIENHRSFSIHWLRQSLAGA